MPAAQRAASSTRETRSSAGAAVECSGRPAPPAAPGRWRPASTFCTACGAELARSAVALERKVVSVVFVDVVGFTSMSERLDPEDVRRVLDPYYRRAREELERYGGTVEKFIGDAVMALFGSPVSHEDDPERAVRAAYAVREAVHGLASGEDTPALQVRIGITTGEAVVDVNARPDEGKATAHGDVVNAAARLQTGAPVDAILVDERTYRATRFQIDFQFGAATAREGQGAAPARVVGRHPARPHRHRSVAPRPATGRARARDPGAGRRAGRRPVRRRAADGDAGRPTGHRQVAPGVGALPARRAERRPRLLAAGQVAALRRRRHLLGAGRDRQGATPASSRPIRRRSSRRSSGSRSRTSSRTPTRRAGSRATCRPWPDSPAHASYAATTASRRSRPGAGSSRRSPPGARSSSSSRTCTGRTTACSSSSRITSAAASRAACWCSSPAAPS